MAMMLWSLHNLETTPGPGTLNRLYRRACDDFGAYTPQQRAMAVTALGLHTHGELGAPAAEFLERTVHSLRVDLPTFKLKVCRRAGLRCSVSLSCLGCEEHRAGNIMVLCSAWHRGNTLQSKH